MNTELARQLANHDKWKWMPGMRALCDTICPRRYVAYHAGGDNVVYEVTGSFNRSALELSTSYPDLDDQATVGCLLYMLKDTGLSFEMSDDMSTWIGRDGVTLQNGSTPCVTNEPGEALALALLKAWK